MKHRCCVYNYGKETGKHSIVDLVSLFFDEMEKHDSELIQMREMNTEKHEYERVNSFYQKHSLAPHRKTMGDGSNAMPILQYSNDEWETSLRQV